MKKLSDKSYGLLIHKLFELKYFKKDKNFTIVDSIKKILESRGLKISYGKDSMWVHISLGENNKFKPQFYSLMYFKKSSPEDLKEWGPYRISILNRPKGLIDPWMKK